MSKKRPCSVCRRWFLPDRRVGARQRTCSHDCGAVLRQRTQAAWRGHNPDYWTARRVEAQVAKAEDAPSDARQGGSSGGDAPRGGGLRFRPPPAEVARVPWELVQDEFGVQGCVLIALILRLALRRPQDEMRHHPQETKGDSRRHPVACAQDESDTATPGVLDC